MTNSGPRDSVEVDDIFEKEFQHCPCCGESSLQSGPVEQLELGVLARNVSCQNCGTQMTEQFEIKDTRIVETATAPEDTPGTSTTGTPEE
jgi:transcription elongation factor Elf1